MSEAQFKEEAPVPGGIVRGTACDSLLRDFKEERRLLSVLSFMRKERMLIIQREISGMRERLHSAGSRSPDASEPD